MAKKYDGWIAKDKNGDFWFGTFCRSKSETIAHIGNTETAKKYGLKAVKVKLVEVEK